MVDQGSGKLLAKKIMWAYNNQSQLNKIGAKGKELYDSRFSQKAQSYKIDNILQKVLN